jgi:hypothetical protein
MKPLLLALALACALSAAAAGAPRPPAPKPGGLKPPLPAFDPAGFAAMVDNPYFPLRPGTVRIYETRGGRAPDTDTVVVTRERRVILGVTTLGVRARSFRGGKLAAERRDWYAQDRKGSVWILARESRLLRDSLPADTTGSWEAGRDSACAGIVMPAVPDVGMDYRRAYRRGVVEDLAEVLNLDAKVLAMDETFTACVETEEWSALGHGPREQKVYAPGLGLVSRRTVTGMGEWTKLVKVIAP